MTIIPPTRGDVQHGSNYSREHKFKIPEYPTPVHNREVVEHVVATTSEHYAAQQPEIDLGLEALELASEKAAIDSIVFSGGAVVAARLGQINARPQDGVYNNSHEFKLAA